MEEERPKTFSKSSDWNQNSKNDKRENENVGIKVMLKTKRFGYAPFTKTRKAWWSA